MNKYLRISSYPYIRKPFLIYNFATAPLWISSYIKKILFSFLSVHNGPFTEGADEGDIDPLSNNPYI